MEQFKIPISSNLANYINRLIFEINNKAFVICRMFEKNAFENTDMLNSYLFQKYYKEYELLFFEYKEVTDEITRLVNGYLKSKNKNPDNYLWNINDFVNDLNIIIQYTN